MIPARVAAEQNASGRRSHSRTSNPRAAVAATLAASHFGRVLAVDHLAAHSAKRSPTRNGRFTRQAHEPTEPPPEP